MNGQYRNWSGEHPELEREGDEAREAVSAGRAGRKAYEEIEETYCRECAEHDRMRRLSSRLGISVSALVVMLVISVLVAWHLVA